MIDWDDLLGTADHKTALETLHQQFSSMEKAADHLGVSKIALRAKLLEVGIQMRPRGGLNQQTRQLKSRLDAIPERFFREFPVSVIAEHFGVYPSAVYKYVRRRGITLGRKPDAIVSGEDNQDEDNSMSGESSVGESDLDAGERQGGLPNGGVPSDVGELQRRLQSRRIKTGGGTTE